MIPNGHYKIIKKIRIKVFSSTIITGFPLVLIFGILGAAYANLICEFIGLSLLINQLKNTINKKNIPEIN